jgi:gliding motility-associated-like protein
MNTFFTKSTLKPLILAFASVLGFSLAANAQTFTNNTPEACGHTLYTGSFATTFSRDIAVSGVGNSLGANAFLRQINIELGDAGCTRNLTSYSLQLVSPTGTTYTFQSGITSTNTLQWINVKFRDNPALERIDQYPVTVQQNYWPYCIGYYKTETDNGFNNFNGQDPNGTWKLRISKTNAAATTGIAFKHVDLVFDNAVLPIRDYTAVTANNSCAGASCLSNGVSIGTNNGYAANDPLFPGTTVGGCSWNGANNNSTWFYFIANATTASLTLSGIVNTTAAGANDTQPIVLAAPSPDNCTIAPSLVPAGGCPETSTVTTSCYSNSTDPYTNGISSNMQFDLSGLTVGNKYYVYVDGNGGVSSTFYMEMNNAQACACTLTASATQSTAAGCDGITFGSANAVGTNGASPYTYLWDNGSTLQAPANFTAGTHTVTITDNTACTATATCTIGTLTQASTTTMNGTTGPLTVCAGATINMQTLGSLPAGASVDWYSSTTAGNTPPTNSVLLGNTNATGCSAVCPQMLAIFINACDGAANDEPKNEYIIFSSGGGFNANDFQLKYSNPTAGVNANVNLGVAPCMIQTPTASLIASLQVGLCTPANLIPVAPGSFVPSGANVVFFTSNGVTSSYNFQPLCGAGQTIYVMQSGCTRTSGAFGNGVLPCTPAADAIRTTTLSLANCPTCVDSIAYSRCGIGNTDGEYAIKLPNNVVSSVANGGILIDAGNPCNGPNLSALPVSADTLRFSFATTAANCNTTRYIKGVVNPNTAGCPNYTQEFVLNVVCPAATITKVDATCNLSNGTATADPGTTLPVTYLWNNGATTAAIANLASGTYTVTVTAVGAACASTASVTITSSFSVTTVDTPSSCGACNGSSTATVTGGTAPYTYTWTNTATGAVVYTGTSNTINTLCGGTYTVSVSDASGTTSVATIFNETFDAANAWTLNVASGANATDSNIWEINDSEGGVAIGGCGVANNGDKTLHITCRGVFCLGTGAIYNAFNAQTNIRAESPTISTIGQTNMKLTFDYIGNGQALVDDTHVMYNANGAGWVVLTANLKSPLCGQQGKWTGFTIALPPACENIANLKIGFNWRNNTDNIGSDPSVAINNLKITKTTTALACTASAAVTIAPSTAASVTVSTVPANTTICNGASVTLNANTAAGSLSWNTTPAQTTASITVSPTVTTTYTVTVTVSPTCTATASVTVTVNQVNGLASQNSGTSCGLANGCATAVAFPAAGASVVWDNGATTLQSCTLNAGTHTVTITVANGCTVTRTVTIATSAALSVSVTPTPTNCGQSIGAAAATVNSGTATYAWSSGQTGQNIVGLAAGTYTVTATAAANCTAVTSFVVNNQSAPVLTPNSINETCGASNGSVGVSLPFGFAATYVWNTIPVQTTATATNLSAGIYTVTATTAIGNCIINTSITITNTGIAPTVSATATPTTCGLTNGTATAVHNGTSVLWSTGANTLLLNTLAANTYTVTSTNIDGCTASSQVTVAASPALPNITFTNYVATVCSQANGGVTAVSDVAGCTFLWSSIPQQNAATLSNVTAGSYSVTVTDAAGCTVVSTAQAIMNNNPTLTPSFALYDPTCNATDGRIETTVTTAGGVTIPTLNFAWNPVQPNAANISGLAGGTYNVTITAGSCSTTASATLANNTLNLFATTVPTTCGLSNGRASTNNPTGATTLWSNNETTPTIQNLAAGTYTVTVSIGAVCSSVTTVVVAPSTGFAIGAASVVNECDGGANGAIALDNVIGSTVVYNWSNGAVTKNITGLLAGTYTVTATSTGVCTLTSTFVIGAFNTPVLTPAVTQPTCGLNNGSITVTSNIPGVIINWVFQPSTPTRSNLAPGTYEYFSNSNGGCASPVTPVLLNQSTNTATVTLPTSPTLYLGQSTILVATGSIGGTPGGGLYLWSTAETGRAITVAPVVNSIYTVTFTDAFSCTASASVNVIILKGEYEIPNFFTPNGDGANDEFSLVSNEGNGIKLLKMQIFNRWGELIHDADTPWNGNYKDAPQVMDTYVYIMTVKMPDGKEETKYGDIFLIR